MALRLWRQGRRGRSAKRAPKHDGAPRAARLWHPALPCALSGVLAASQMLAQEPALRCLTYALACGDAPLNVGTIFFVIMEKRIDDNTNAGPEPLDAFLQRYDPDRGQQEWERARKVPPEEVRTDTNGGVTDTREGFNHHYGQVQGQFWWAEAIPVQILLWVTFKYPPNAIVMNDTQIAQSTKGGLKGGQKKAKCREVIPSSCTACATT